MKPSAQIKIRSLHSDRCGVCIEKVEALGTNEVAGYTCDAEGLSVTLKHAPRSPLPQCLKITLA